MTTFTTPGPISADIIAGGALIRLTATDRSDTVVLVEPVDPGNRKDVRVADKTSVSFADGELRVKTVEAGDRSGSVTISIELPAGSTLVAELAHSTLQADGPLGRCELGLASGRIRLDRIEALHAGLGAGEVEIGSISGPADIRSGAASVRIGEALGAVTLLGSSGQVRIGEAAADLDLTNSTGGFEIGTAHAGVTAMTGGDAPIRIGRMTNGRADLTNASGDIEVGVADGTSALVSADSRFGSVHNSVPQPATAAATVTVEAHTRRGNIVIRPAAARSAAAQGF